MNRTLETTKGTIQFPVYMPVTTYGKYPIDDLIRPYLPRFTQCIMVSHYYAQSMRKPPDIPLFIDSGGFASLFQDSEIVEDGEFATIITGDGTFIDPESVLEFQIKHGQIGATLDFIVPPRLSGDAAVLRQEMTIRNAVWASRQSRPQGFKLFASVQAWDRESAIRCMQRLVKFNFDGFALGGMVPRISAPDSIHEVVAGIRAVERDRPLHVFGIGKIDIIESLFKAGVDSVDSSSYVQHAVQNRAYTRESQTDCSCVVCRRFNEAYVTQRGETNQLALALHNLHCATKIAASVIPVKESAA